VKQQQPLNEGNSALRMQVKGPLIRQATAGRSAWQIQFKLDVQK
jgi:hypothetical protein